jgi:hypothetical protein
MSFKNESPAQSDGENIAAAVETSERPSEQTYASAVKAHRRQALNLSLAGGLAAVLAACGKYVARFDKFPTNLDGGLGKKGDGDGEGINKQGGGDQGAVDPNNPNNGDPNNPVDPNTPPKPGLKPGTCLPVSVQIVDTSEKAGITVDDTAVDAHQHFFGRSSRLLAIKFASGKLAQNDFVHLVGKANAADTSGKILATRRVQSTDLSNNVAKLVFESLTLMGMTHVDVVLVRPNSKTKKTLDLRPVRDTIDGMEVIDLAKATLSNEELVKVFDTFEFGKTNPRMGNSSNGTSDIGGSKVTLGKQFQVRTAYTAATDGSTWNTADIIPTNAYRVEDIYGDVIPASSHPNLFAKMNTFIVYLKKTVGNKTVLVRHFIFIG